ncbi:MAG: bifunctional UDP-N-acetylmuramoyl-tripeptide:D-alanyl-D-alanine ligase/alanine racemase [Bacteroidales bacterium]
MQYTLKEIAIVVKGELLGNSKNDITQLLTDSRSLIYPEETLFFALISSQNDGHNYIEELYDKGVRNFVVSDRMYNPSVFPNAAFIVVKDTLLALQDLARYHRERFCIPIIGITGSNGKTIVKEWLYQLMQDKKRIIRSPRSYNSQIGVPLSVWGLDEKTELGIFEAGISQSREMRKISSIIRPTVGVFTNLGDAHQEGFESKREKCMEKLQLFKDCSFLIYNADNELLVDCLREACLGASEFAWSYFDKSLPLFIEQINKEEYSTEIVYIMLGIRYKIVIPFIDDSSIENAIHCLAVMLYFGFTFEEISDRMKRLTSVAMRLEVKDGERNCLIINDSYSLDMSSLETALDFTVRRSQNSRKSKVIVLSDIFQTGLLPAGLYKQVSKLLKSKGIDRMIGIGPELCLYAELFDLPAEFYESTEAFLRSGGYNQFQDEVVLLKGARKFRFEDISDALELKMHETILEVNLEALVYNFNYYKQKLEPSTKVVCMVKAFGYGAGSFELAKTLQEYHCDYLAVAVVDEGVELRKAGIHIPIIVMNPEISSLQTLFAHRLEPEVYSFRMLRELKAKADSFGITEYPIHIKIDSGMKRLGFASEDIEELAVILQSQTSLKVKSVFSHLAGSDDPALDHFTLHQIEVFKYCAEILENSVGHKVLKHILNTGGIERFSQYQFDMVRLGIGLYGVPAYDKASKLKNVSTLKSTILQIKEVDVDESVGYGRMGRLAKKARIATIPIGYADGLNRKLGNGVGALYVNGQRAPIVGNICMDLCMIDITDIDHVVEGAQVIVFGDEQPVSVIAEQLGTIPYEVITSISSRVKRVYYI